VTEVLAVDDNDTIRASLRFILEDAGYAVFEAWDGRSALDRLADHPEGMIVLLDLAMPGMDGTTLLEALHAQPALAARHPIIIVTAYADIPFPKRLAELIDTLSVQVVDKPFSIDEMLQAVQSAEQRLPDR
jgi:CheY-like chemotaxis protein